MTRPLRAQIDLVALRHNFFIARKAAPQAHIWSVIKANAYGHGALRVAQALADVSDGFAMLELDTAMALRQAGLPHRLLMMEGFYERTELALFDELGLEPVLHRLDQVRVWAGAAMQGPHAVTLKLNTGMNRLGLEERELAAALAILAECPHRGPVTLMTHFSDADEARGVREQLQTFRKMAEPYPELAVCLSNSAALLRFPETFAAPGNGVRPGIMLYGGSPFPDLRTAADLGLRPVMSLLSEVIAVRDIQPGDRVGYGGKFIADVTMRIGIVSGGYGDGYPRHAPTGTPVMVAGQRTRLLGRVSMDKLFVDLSHIPHATVGSAVLLWGADSGVELAADEVASAAGTISYELFCAVTSRVPMTEMYGANDGQG